MNEALKNPFLVLIAALLAIWLIFKILNIIVSLFSVFVIAFVLLYIINSRFRDIIQGIFKRLFKD